jgi:hypothetical protein
MYRPGQLPGRASVIGGEPQAGGEYHMFMFDWSAVMTPHRRPPWTACVHFRDFYVTDGNIMYLTDASRFLISCVIQHYAPVVGWGVEEQMHNVDYDPGS